jgi:hypothetical protein
MQCVFDDPIHANGGCIFADPTKFLAVVPSPDLEPSRGSGPTTGIRRERYDKHREDALRETRRNRIIREDDDIVSLIVSMLTKDLM